MAAAHMPRVDAIGVSSAGIYIDNRVMVASLFRGVPDDLFRSKAQDMFLRIQKDWGGVPLEVANDGDVTALAGSMSLGEGCVLGIAMGSDEAGGYVNVEGNITGWLNELAFAPLDLNLEAPLNEWSGDRGCGGEYFSQKAVIRLAPAAGIELDEGKRPAERLKDVQALMAQGDERAARIYQTIGCYLGYAVAHYADFYELRHVLILGRVTSGQGGQIILAEAKMVLQDEFPALLDQISLNLPNEANRRVGQAIAAASLPAVQ
jgi:predicted NBD/HSP70 family sugar kinase